MAPDDLPPRGDLAASGHGAAAAPQGPRQTLAMRLAERNRQRELRAERLARLHPAAARGSGPVAGPAPSAPDESAPDESAPDESEPGEIGAGGNEAAEAALEDFLKALTGDLPPLPEGPPIEPGELLPFERPAAAAAAAAPAAAGDLDRLPGVGPGLVWALERAGFHRLADLAPLAPAELAARLGPLGRLVPAERWIATARAAAEG